MPACRAALFQCISIYATKDVRDVIGIPSTEELSSSFQGYVSANRRASVHHLCETLWPPGSVAGMAGTARSFNETKKSRSGKSDRMSECVVGILLRNGGLSQKYRLQLCAEQSSKRHACR